MTSTLIHSMASALHPEPDSEDEAAAYVCAEGLAAWLASPDAFTAALAGVNRWAESSPSGHLSYGDTVRAALAGLADHIRVLSEGIPAEAKS